MLDHGILNIPLARRGNIDAQIDADKAQMARDAKASARALHADRQAARAAVLAMSDARCVELSRGQMTAKQARKKLFSIARFTPQNILRVVGGAA